MQCIQPGLQYKRINEVIRALYEHVKDQSAIGYVNVDCGAKPPRNKTDEIQLFVLFQQPKMPEQQITPFKIQLVEGENHKMVNVHKVPNKQGGFDPLDPLRPTNAKQYDLVLQTVKDKLSLTS